MLSEQTCRDIISATNEGRPVIEKNDGAQWVSLDSAIAACRRAYQLGQSQCGHKVFPLDRVTR